MEFSIYNLFVTSKNETRNFRFHQFTNLKCCIMNSLLKHLFNGVLFLIYYIKKQFKPCLFMLKTFCSTLNSRIGEFVLSFFDVKNRLLYYCVIRNPLPFIELSFYPRNFLKWWNLRFKDDWWLRLRLLKNNLLLFSIFYDLIIQL